MPASPEVPPGTYAGRVAHWRRLADEKRGRSAVLARVRLATFLAASAALLWWLVGGGGVPAFATALGLYGVFAAFVVVHARVEEAVAWLDALTEVNRRGLARVNRDWHGLPDGPAPAGISLDDHPYAADLDVFGHASLFQLLGPAATPAGASTLAGWLMTPSPAGAITERHTAVRELSALDGWREHLAAFGITSAARSGEPMHTFLRWAESDVPALPAYGAVRIAVSAISGTIWTFLLLHVTGVLPNSIWGLAVLAGMILSFVTAWRVTQVFDQAGAGERTLRTYAHVFEHIENQSFSAAPLQALKSRLRGQGRPAPQAMRHLNRLLGLAELRRGTALLHFPIQALTLWDFHCLFALEAWRRGTGRQVRAWFESSGEMDALACLATLARDEPSWTFPTFDAAHRLEAVQLAHPLLAGGRRVANDVSVGPSGTVLLITGSNMSGKSTLLRAIGLNAVLAQSGAPVCASSFRLTPCDVHTSIRIQDSLEHGISYFMAALARLKSVVDAARREPGGRVLLYLLDEILQGTNSAERGIAVQAVTRHLLTAGAIGAMTTHDLNLAEEEPLRSTARLVHFTETVDEAGKMSFDYRLREGLATSRNALRLMELIGIHVPR